MLDLAIIGSGPNALSLVSKILCSDRDQSTNFAFGFESKPHLSTKNVYRKLIGGKPRKDLLGKIKVFDKHGSWMSSWDALFQTLGIEHLRSVHTAHPCPLHSTALAAFAHESKRYDEEMKELDSLKYTGIHVVPSTALFHDFCEAVSDAFAPGSLIQKATVNGIVPVFKDAKAAQGTGRCVGHFEVHITKENINGLKEVEVVEAKKVVFAGGSTTIKNIPQWWSDLGEHFYPDKAIKHAWDLPYVNYGDMRGMKLLIVGGGLTSAQLCRKAFQDGCRNITLVVRDELLTKQFDNDTKWMDKHERPKRLNYFYSSTMSERAKIIQQARGRGSIPPEGLSILKDLEGVVKVRTETEVSQLEWCSTQECWKVTLESWDTNADKHVKQDFSVVWCATGNEVDVYREPILKNMMAKYPIAVERGLPCIHESLAWVGHGCDFFVMGAYASLALGPDAFNLLGARTGAGRLAPILTDWLTTGNEEELEKAKEIYTDMRLTYDSGKGTVKVGKKKKDAVVTALAAP